MRWTRRGPSENLEDRRGDAREEMGGGRMRLPLPGGRLSLGGAIALVAVMWLLGVDPSVLLGGGGPGTNVGIDPTGSVGSEPGAQPGAFSANPEEEDLVQFVSFVLDDLQTTWHQLLPGYRDARLVLFREATRSACGTGQAEMGPFYCPGDEKVYVDLSFYGELRSRFGAPGDFAQAYVIAHEFGHHVQNLLGLTERAAADRRSGANSASVAIELQADCFAGVWGHEAARQGRAAAGKVELDPGDLEEALRAASAIGDDRLQKMSTGRVMPDRFTHGSSAQRVEWFRRGMESGDPRSCGGSSTMTH